MEENETEKLPDEPEKLSHSQIINSGDNYKLIYSPRTTFSNEFQYEEELFNDLTMNFDPITIKIIKKHFKERLGSLELIEFITILKNHLLSWHPDIPNREKILIKLLRRLFSEIDLNDNGSMEWSEITNYIIHNDNSGGDKGDSNSSTFKLRFYYQSRKTIDTNDMADKIGYAFYIEKSSIVGVVENDKSIINFYDGNSLRKLKCQIDLRDVQKDIDYLELRELDEKAKIKKKNEHELKLKHLNLNRFKKGLVSNIKKDEIFSTILEENKSPFKSYNFLAENNSTKQILTNHVNKKLTVLCTIYLQEFDVLLVSGSNNRITAWKFSNGDFKNVNTISDPPNIDQHYFLCYILMNDSPQYTMAWDNMQKYLYTGQIDGKILKWDLTKINFIGVLDIMDIKTKSKLSSQNKHKIIDTKENQSSMSDPTAVDESDIGIKTKKSKYIRRDSVSFILLITKMQLLAACYCNGMIILWDTLLMEKRKIYEDHKTGIYSLTYDVNKNLLFSCGFSRDIYVYDPYIDFPVYKLTGHYGSIQSIICSEKESELISLDAHGIIKIWDTQLLTNFQTINISETNNSSKTSSGLKMIYLKKQKKIMVYGNKIQFFENDRSQNPDQADDQITFACFFDKGSKSIISFCLKKVKIWNPFTGKIKKIYEDPMQNEITALAIDKNMKRIFLGDNTGKIKNFNMKNGKFIKNLASHSVEINMIAHSQALNIVVSSSIDNVIKIHDDKELMDSFIIKEIVLHSFQIKAISIIDHLKRLAIGLSSGDIKFYDLEHFRYDSDLNSESKAQEEVTCIFPFNNVELIFSTHSTGVCKFMIIPPSPFKLQVFCEFYNTSIKDIKNHIPVTSVEYDYINNRLFIGDQLGNISCYSLTSIFELIENTKISLSKDKLLMNLSMKISQEFIDRLSEISIRKIWTVEAHHESIKHINYTDTQPNIIISTSHDMRVKIMSAADGGFIDELKQISKKFNPVPIGIKYEGVDPLTKISYKQTVWREDISRLNMLNIDEIEDNKNTDFSNKITLINAREKLLQHCRKSNVATHQSNKWNLMLDIETVKREENEMMREIYEEVSKKEILIKQTEEIMQKKSIYEDSYRPLFINEMGEDKIKEFSKILSQKLRYLKLAITKVNIGQNKLENEIKEETQEHIIIKDHTNNIKRKQNKNKSHKSLKSNLGNDVKEQQNDYENDQNNENDNNSVKTYNKSQIKSSSRQLKPLGKNKLRMNKNKKEINPDEIFNNCKLDLDNHIKDLIKPLETLAKKGNLLPIDQYLLNKFSHDNDESNLKN